MRSKRWMPAALISGFVLITIGVTTFVTNVYGQGAGGGGSGACTNYCTDNGFAWKKYSVSSGGPSGGFTRQGTYWEWSEVQRICRNVQDVWIYVVRNGVGTERAFAFATGNGISASGPPYSAYTNRLYYGAETIDRVRQYYNEAVAQGISGTSGLTWGTNLEWFCYGQTPWDISVSSSVDTNVAEVGDTITWTHTVSNSGPGATTSNVTWHYQNRGDWNNSAGPDWTLGSGSGRGASSTRTSSHVVQPSDFGTRICRATSASPRSNTNSGWVESAAACTVIAKKPKTHVLGGDLIVGRGSATNPSQSAAVTTSVSRGQDGRYYGSWSEYGIVASGRVTGMASGSAYVGGAGSSAMCGLSLLTFTNSGTSTCGNGTVMGRYATTTTAPNVAQRFPVTAATPRISAASTTLTALLGSQDDVFYTSNNAALSISGGADIPAGNSVVINAPNTDVTITGDIRYTTGALSSVDDIPQVVIIARNIIVDSRVTNIDSWLVAVGSGNEGRINTCGAGPGGITRSSPVTARVCDARLTVNGPISANHLDLRRTAGAGSGAAVDDPAEVFNLRADSYIWATAYTPGTGRLPTVQVTELPPRF